MDTELWEWSIAEFRTALKSPQMIIVGVTDMLHNYEKSVEKGRIIIIWGIEISFIKDGCLYNDLDLLPYCLKYIVIPYGPK